MFLKKEIGCNNNKSTTSDDLSAADRYKYKLNEAYITEKLRNNKLSPKKIGDSKSNQVIKRTKIRIESRNYVMSSNSY